MLSASIISAHQGFSDFPPSFTPGSKGDNNGWRRSPSHTSLNQRVEQISQSTSDTVQLKLVSWLQLSGGRRSEEDPLDSAISHLENGVLLLSAIRDGGQCSAKVACKLGQVTRDSFEDTNMIVDAVSFIMPALSTADKYSNFTESFSRVARQEDNSSCSAECSRCLLI